MGKRKIIYFTVMLLIPVAFLELALQAYYRISNGDFLYQRVELAINSPDPHRVFRTKSNLTLRQRTNEFDATYYTNSQGLRTDFTRPEISIEKPADTYRILFLGPSFTFGWANNYEDTFVYLIASELSTTGKEIEIMNLGTPGQPISYQLCWLEQVGHRYEPDMVVQTAYGNPTKAATRCHIPEDHPTVHRGYLYNSTSSLRVRFLSVVKNSATVFYGWYLYQFAVSSDNDIGLGTELYEPDSDDLAQEDYPGRVEKYEQNVAFVRQALKRDVPVIFLHVPFSYVVRPADLSRWTATNLVEPSVLRHAARQMDVALQEAGIPFVNPLNELIAKDREARTYFFLDLHFTPAGNKVLAEKSIPLIQELISLGVGGASNVEPGPEAGTNDADSLMQ